MLDTESARQLVRKIEETVRFMKYSPNELSASLVALAALGSILNQPTR
jgi:hypothetical protein